MYVASLSQLSSPGFWVVDAVRVLQKVRFRIHPWITLLLCKFLPLANTICCLFAVAFTELLVRKHYLATFVRLFLHSLGLKHKSSGHPVLSGLEPLLEPALKGFQTTLVTCTIPCTYLPTTMPVKLGLHCIGQT